MNKIQTWFSDLSDWFYNITNINMIAYRVNLIDDIQDEMLENEDIVEDQIENLYHRVRVLELAESNRQLESLIEATSKSLKKATKKTKKAKKVTKRQ